MMRIATTIVVAILLFWADWLRTETQARETVDPFANVADDALKREADDALMWEADDASMQEAADAIAQESVDSLAHESNAAGGIVLRVRLDDAAITPMTVRLLARVIGEASDSGARALLIELDTPGGLVQSTREIVKDFYSSPVPIIVFVAPSGSRAASAGVFITMAAHVAAMAPGTHIGAAHPVSIGGGGPGDGASSDTSGSVMDEKVMNDLRAWARSIAETRGRNADWAEAAITRSESIVAEEAVEINVVDLLTPSTDSLLVLLDGREVELLDRQVTLRTADATLRTIEPWWGERILGALSNPNVAFILLILGFYGVVFEFYSGGWGVPGTVGALCLLLGFFGMAVLPINIIGLLLIFAGLSLFVAEAFVPSFGLLTIGGVVCLVLGGLMLVDAPTGVVEVSRWIVIPVASASGLIAFFLMGEVVRVHRSPVQTGAEMYVGAKAVAAEDFSEENGSFRGMVYLEGELWTARSLEPLAEGDSANVVERSGLTLTVEPAS